MEGLSRQEYPAMLARLQPAEAVSKLNERVKKITKLNNEVADWLQERRKVEEAYVAGLKKLVRRPLPEIGPELGIFETPWQTIIASIETIANSHAQFSKRAGQDAEQPLRNFGTTNREMQAMTTIQGNLASLARELEDAQEKSDKLTKKGKASAQKTENAASKLQSANQQWDSQAPFVFETLQALDETRLNHLRDVLTQYATHETDQLQSDKRAVEHNVTALLDVDTSQEIKDWSQAATAGKPITEKRARQLSSVGTTSSSLVPPTPRTSQHDTASAHSGRQEGSDSNLRSRFGTMLSRRRQSMVGGFARAPSPSKGSYQSFGRNSASRDGRPAPSPRTSSNNLRESTPSDNRLSALPESPPSLSPTSQTNGNLHGIDQNSSLIDVMDFANSNRNGSAGPRTPDLSDVQPPPGPPPSHSKKDSEGFTVPGAMNDPISQAQHEATQDNDQPQFKLDIKNEPIPEQDADAQAALSNVANTLRSTQLTTPGRKVGTVRGRRDVRNTIYVPNPNSLDGTSSHNNINIPPSPSLPTAKSAAVTALSHAEHVLASSVSDTTSIRSGHSVGIQPATKHENARPNSLGLNASIIETVHATFENGEVKTLKVGGEIAFTYIKTPQDTALDLSTETVRINNFPNLEAIGPNRTFVHAVSEDKPDEFTMDRSSLSAKATVAFTYRVNIDEINIASQGPLLIKAAWRPQTENLGLILEYRANPAFTDSTLSFTNLTLIAHYEGAKAHSCQTKPSGTHLKDKSIIFWKLGEVVVPQEWTKIICRFNGVEGAVPQPGRIDAKFEVGVAGDSAGGSGITLSRLEPSKGKEKEESDPFADQSIGSSAAAAASSSSLGTWTNVLTRRKMTSGLYEFL